MTDDEIEQILRSLGVRVHETGDLPDDRDGEYIHSRRLIRLQRGMPRRLRRSVLAHECAHALAGDVPTLSSWSSDRQERRADEWAALQLIDPAAYRAAEQRHAGRLGAMALALDVTTDLVEVYRHLLQTRRRVTLQPPATIRPTNERPPTIP